jgi:hypothetical protein
MPRVSQAEIRRKTTNTSGFETPMLDHGPARPDQVERNMPDPRLVEPPPAGAYALRPVEQFGLVSPSPDAPHAVTEADLPELFEWGIPIYAKRYPGATVDTMMPLVMRAIQGYPYRALRTPAAFGIFMADQKPWMMQPIVFDIVIAWHSPDDIHQVVAICRAARAWAKSIKATEFQLIECGGNLALLAERLGLQEIATTHSYGCEL